MAQYDTTNLALHAKQAYLCTFFSLGLTSKIHIVTSTVASGDDAAGTNIIKNAVITSHASPSKK